MKLIRHIRSMISERKTTLNTVPNLKRGGFSLVEVSLALLVVSIGMLSLVGLFPASLQMSKNAIDETYASFLADSAFSSYKEVCNVSTNYNWGNLETYETIGPNTIRRGLDVFWRNSFNLRLVADGNVHTLLFDAADTPEKWNSTAQAAMSGFELEDHALRYRLSIYDPDPADPRIRRVMLEIWMGEFGDVAVQKPEVFYTEIFRHDW